jgi:hypothetical protein
MNEFTKEELQINEKEKCIIKQKTLQSLFNDLKNLVNLINDDNNQVWEQPKITCKKIDFLAMEIRDLLPSYEAVIKDSE